MIKQPWGLARLPAMTTQPPSAPAEHLAVVHALRVFSESAEHAVDEAGRGVGLHRTDLRALALLMARAEAGEPVTASDLGAHLHLTRASATALVDRLAAAGHVRRHRDEGDRRRVLVEHTDTARRDGQRGRPTGPHADPDAPGPGHRRRQAEGRRRIRSAAARGACRAR